MAEPKDKFENLIDEWLKDAPLLPDFRGFFIKRVEEKFIEWLEQVYESSERLYKSAGRRIALPGDIFKAVKILNINWCSGDIEVFYEHFKQQMDKTPEKLEVKALYEHFVKYKEASEYLSESEVTGEARTKQLECAAQERAKWKKEFVQDKYLEFPPAMDTVDFRDIKEQRRMKPEDTVEFLESAVRQIMIRLASNIQGRTAFQEHMVKGIKNFLKDMYAKYQEPSLQVQEITVEQQKFIAEACDSMIAEFKVKKAERGFDARTATVADLSNEDLAVADLSNEDMDAFFSVPSVADTPPYDACSAHIDQRLKRKRIDIDLNVSPEVDVHQSDDDHENS